MNVSFNAGQVHSRKKIEVIKASSAAVSAILKVEDGEVSLTREDVAKLVKAFELIEL